MTLNGRMTVTAAVACMLAATALFPLFSTSLWFVIAAGGVIVVAAAGALTRLRPLPAPACLAGSAAGLLLYLNLVFEARHSLLFVIPTPGSLTRLWDLLRTGMDEANEYAPPVPNLAGLLLLAAGGVGIAAVVTDLIAVRLRSTALAGLPLLVLFTVPVMMNASHDQLATGLTFCLGGAGYLAMLSADGRERIRVWGRLVGLWRPAPRYDGAFSEEEGRAEASRRLRGRGPSPDTRALAAAGRRVGLASIVLALCAPLLLPGLHPSKLFSSGPGIGGDGSGGSGASLSLPGALAQTVTQLRENHPSTVFTYTTNASPAQQDSDAQYFTQYVFDSLAENGWQVSDYSAHTVPIADLPNPAGLTDTTPATTVTTTVTVSRDFPGPGSQPTFLPLPYPAIHVDVPGKWLADPDRMVYSTGDSIAGRSYSVASVAVDPSQQQLDSVPGLVKTEILAADLQLPSSYKTAALENVADTYTAGQTSEFGKVDALANWLSGGQFSYNLTVAPLNSAASLLTFLTRTKSGFCVQYAYAMTVLARLLGIPARFVVGYTAGTRLKNGSYQVRTTDAHAWTEVYFPTFGWIRFEPTPAGQGTADPPNYMTSGTGTRSAGREPPDHRGDRRGGRPEAEPQRRRPQPSSSAGWFGRVDRGCGGRPGRDPVDRDRTGRDRGPRAGLRPDHPHRHARPPHPRHPARNPLPQAPGRHHRRRRHHPGRPGHPGPVPAHHPHPRSQPRRRLGHHRPRVRRHRRRRPDHPRRVPPRHPPLALDARPRRHQPRPRRLARLPRRPRRLRPDQPPQRTTPHPGRPHHHHLAPARRRRRHPARPRRRTRQLRRPPRHITAPAPRRQHRPPRTRRHRPPHHPLARHPLPRLHDHRPHPRRRPHPRPRHRTQPPPAPPSQDLR